MSLVFSTSQKGWSYKLTPEQRLNRLERIAKLFVREGQRERSKAREIDQKINMLITEQGRNEDKISETRLRNEEEILKFQIRNEDELQKLQNRNQVELQKLQKRNEDELQKLQMRNEDELHRVQIRNEEALRAMGVEMDRRSNEVFELFRLTDEKINRLTEVQTVFEHKLNSLIEGS